MIGEIESVMFSIDQDQMTSLLDSTNYLKNQHQHYLEHSKKQKKREFFQAEMKPDYLDSNPLQRGGIYDIKNHKTNIFVKNDAEILGKC